MKISEIITDKYKLRMPPTVYYDLLADALEAEDELEPKTGHWITHKHNGIEYMECSECSTWFLRLYLTRNSYCPNCGCRMVDPQESEKV